jgi:haloalkane dehalogenase
MIPVFLAAGYRVVAPDLVGFGRSDKPARKKDYSYANQVAWMNAWLMAVDLNGINLFCQDWGSLVGLRMVAHAPDRFDRIVLANGGLPTGSEPVPKAFKWWRAFSLYSPIFPIGKIVKSGCAQGLSDEAIAAYNAPFPDGRYKVAARVFPSFVPTSANDPEHHANTQAWKLFKQWQKPFLTLFSTRDPITKGGEKIWQKLVPGAKGQPHAATRGAGHFLQEDKGVEVAEAMVAFIRSSPLLASSNIR